MKYLPDVLAVSGGVLIGYGTWLVFPPAGFVIFGVLCIIAALAMNKAQ